MSLILITNPTSTLTLSSQWTDFVNREDHSNIGVGTSIPIFRLTNWDTGTARPLVAEGAIVEVGGSLYQADSDTALVDDTGLVDGLCFIKLVPGTGTPDPTTVVPTLTSDTMPAFDAEQGGWYDGDNKFLPILMTRSGSGTSYVNKGEYIDQNQNVIRYIDGGTYMSGAAQVGGALTVGAGATFSGAVSGITDLTTSGSLAMSGSLSGVTSLSTVGYYKYDSNETLGSIATEVLAYMGSAAVGSVFICSFMYDVYGVAYSDPFIGTHVEKISASEIEVFGFGRGTSGTGYEYIVQSKNITTSTTTVADAISISIGQQIA